jgi:murein DD-endopeptidase MepM/ murein hydrolase activator NlpD
MRIAALFFLIFLFTSQSAEAQNSFWERWLPSSWTQRTRLAQSRQAPQVGRAIDPAYANTRVTFTRTNVSERATAVYDRNGRKVGSFYSTQIEVPMTDQAIGASIVSGRINPRSVVSGMLNSRSVIQTPNGPMVRVLVSAYDRWVPEPNRNNAFNVSGISQFGPSGAYYVPLSEFQPNARGSTRMRATGLTLGSSSRPNPVYSRFSNAVRESSGYMAMSPSVQNEMDPHAGHDSSSGNATLPTVNVREFSMFPPTCDCAQGVGSCRVSSHFWEPGMPERTCRGCSRRHRGLDIACAGGSALGTTLVAPDRVVVHRAGERGGYGFQVTLRSLIYTSPQVYYTYSHLPRIEVTLGQQLEPGDFVGHIGHTGSSTAPHLHLEVFRGTLDDERSRINPYRSIRMGIRPLAQAPEMLGYSCDTLRARIRGGPSICSNGQCAGGSAVQ